MDNLPDKKKVAWIFIVFIFIFAAIIWFQGRLSSSHSQKQQSFEPVRPARLRIDFTQAWKHVGEYACVTGKVDNVYTSQTGIVFINYSADSNFCLFSAVIFKSNASKFANPAELPGKKVEITGLIISYQGPPEIVLENPNQIKIEK